MSNEIKKQDTASECPMHATPELSKIIELLIAESPVADDPTLGDIRTGPLEPHVFWSKEGELLYAQDQTVFVIELDELIERYGAQAHARDFVERKGA